MEQLLGQIFTMADNHFLLALVVFAASLAHAFLPFVPVEAGSVCAGYMVSLGHGSVPVIIISATLGMSLGHLIIYMLSIRHGEAILAMWPFNKLFNPMQYVKMKVLFRRYGVWSLFIAKALPGMAFCSVVCSGIFKLRRHKAIISIIGSNLLQFTGLVFLGKLVGVHWKETYAMINGISGFLLLILLIVAGYLFWRIKRKATTSGTKT
jgi:membrane protein DedA with SNARE-associated domain